MQNNIYWNGLPDRADLGNSVMVAYNEDSGHFSPISMHAFRGFVFESGQVYVPTGTYLSGELNYSDPIESSRFNGMTFYGATSGSEASSFAIYLQHSPDGVNFYSDGSEYVTFSGTADILNSSMTLYSAGAKKVRLKIINLGPDPSIVYAVNETGWYWSTK